jgi:two-component system, chemotaxis family, response regulator Rcp1
MLSTNGRPVEILLVEDNMGDVRLTQEAFKDSKILNNISFVRDGGEAIEYLKAEGKYKGVLRPDIILLDLDLPKKNGREVLSEIKRDENLRRIPVIILTVSKAEDDVIKAYDLHANCFITKPISVDKFFSIVRTIEDFWLSIVRLPTK